MGSASHARRLGASARARLGDASRGAWVDTCADSPPHVMGLVAGLGPASERRLGEGPPPARGAPPETSRLAVPP